MTHRTLLIFGRYGYVGGTIAAAAEAQGQQVGGFSSNSFRFWEDVGCWPWEDIERPVDMAILAASFENQVIQGHESLSRLESRLGLLVSHLGAARTIFLSTDAVFDGRSGPYVEPEPVTPITPYGRCKVAMERTVMQNSRRAHIVRMGTVWGAGATKPDPRRERFLAEEVTAKAPIAFRGATNVFRSPINATNLGLALVRLTHEPILPRILHLATPRVSYREFLRSGPLLDRASSVRAWTDPAFETHDTSLVTECSQLVERLLT